MTPDEYTVLGNDLGAVLNRLCQDSWLLDYYEGKHDGKTTPTDYCAAQPADPKPK